MKKFLCLIICVILIFLSYPTLAESSQYDYSIFMNNEGYSYDKFDKTWNYIKYYTSDKLMLFMAIGGADSFLHIVFSVVEVNSSIGTPQKMQFLLDGELYEIKVAYNVDQGFIVGANGLSGEKGRKFCVALSQASEISIKVTGDKGAVIEDVEGTYLTMFKDSIQDTATKLILSRAFNYATPGLEGMGITNDEQYIYLPNE